LHRRGNKEDRAKPFGAAVLLGKGGVQMLAGALVAKETDARQFYRFVKLNYFTSSQVTNVSCHASMQLVSSCLMNDLNR
jgi:hypothetical protein